MLESLFKDDEPDVVAMRRVLKDKIKIAAKAGDPFIIEKMLLPEYEKMGGSRESITPLLEIAYELGYKMEMELAESLRKEKSPHAYMVEQTAKRYLSELNKIKQQCIPCQ